MVGNKLLLNESMITEKAMKNLQERKCLYLLYLHIQKHKGARYHPFQILFANT